MRSSILEYQRKKEILVRQLKNASGAKIGLRKQSSNLFRKRDERGKQRINVKHFNKVIHIDSKNLVADVEGMITYADLVKETLKKGFMPAVVPQLKAITIGGAISGIGIESSSFRYGLVHETVKEVEVLLGDGSVVVCTPTNKYKDLFFGLPNSYGTLGYILRLKVQLVPVKKYVSFSHLSYHNPKNYFNDLKKLCKDNSKKGEKSFDFIDGTVFSEDEMYITLGKFVDHTRYTSNYKYMRSYYKSIRKRKQDFLTTSDYIWRWDPDWFWKSNNFGMENPLMRLLFGKFMLNSFTYWKIISFYQKSGLDRLSNKENKEQIVQDIGIPVDASAEFLKFLVKTTQFSPIWVCPFQAFNKKAVFDLMKINLSTLYIDFGFWDTRKTNKRKGYYNRLIEKKTKSLKGWKSLYSESYYPEKEFWELYNGKKYKKLKAKYDPKGSFKDLFEKCVKGR